MAHAARPDAIAALDLSGEKEHGGGVDPCRREPRHGVRAAGACRNEDCADFIGVLCVALRRNRSRLLMQTGNVFRTLTPPERIDEVHTAAAGQHEHILDPLLCQKFHDIVG